MKPLYIEETLAWLLDKDINEIIGSDLAKMSKYVKVDR